MSENTATIETPADVVADSETPVVEPTETPSAPAPAALPAAVMALPDDDSKIRLAERGALAAQIIQAASTLPVDKRAELDTRAFKAAAEHLASISGEHSVIHHVEDLPAYGMSGVGSLRYTKQRASILIGVAQEFGCIAELAYTNYSYPNRNTGRRQYHVNVWGSEADVTLARQLFDELEARALKDAYNAAVLPMGELKPAQQTQRRRAWMIDFEATTRSHLSKVVDEVVAAKRADKKISDRKTLAEAAQREWHQSSASAAEEVVDASDDE